MMIKSKLECGNGDGENDWNNGQLLLRDIEEISKALYVHSTPSKPSFSLARNRSKSAGKARLSKPEANITPTFLNEDLLHKDKKFSSVWNWKKPLKALTHIGHQKFNCCFNLHVHSIEGLPLNFDGISLRVHWKRKSSVLQTRPSRVCQGVAEFDETLTHGCAVYGSRGVSGHSVKYESKRFLIFASIVGAPEHDMGNHQVDLARLLPLTLEELWGDKSSGRWSTSFRLAGKAVGASLNVSFSYQVMKNGLMKFGVDNLRVPNFNNLEPSRPSSVESVMGFSPINRDLKILQAGSFSHNGNGLVLPSHSDDVMLSHEASVKPGSGLSKSISVLYQKLDEGDFHNSVLADSDHLGPLKSHRLTKSESDQPESIENEFFIIEQGVEELAGDSLKLDQREIETVDFPTVEIINVDDIIKDDDNVVEKSTTFGLADVVCTSFADGTSEFHGQEHYLCVKSNYKEHKMAKKSHSLDDITESVANDFLNMLALECGSFRSSCDGDPQSPREQLLRQFEKEALASGNFAFDFDAVEEELGTDILENRCDNFAVDSGLSSLVQAAEEEHASANHSLIQRRKAKILEDLETGSLMQQWGLNESDFENTPGTWSGGFGSPIELSSEESSTLPSIGQGFGSFVRTLDGGFLKSMSPSLFRNVKNCRCLITQASNPVVLPAKLGNDILEILLDLASAGIEDLCDHINTLMPLQDITGKSIKHIVSDVRTNRGASRSLGSWQHDLFEEFPCDYLKDEGVGLGSVSLESIAPMTINKIEALLIEGLRIQSSMSNEKAPSYIHPQCTKIPAFGGGRAEQRGFLATESVARLKQEDGGEFGNDNDVLMGLSITLDQWLRFDSGIIEGDQNLEQISKILKVHNCKITALDEGLENAMDMAKTEGLLGNHLTVAFTIQLRDPIRNYEPVGVPMLVLTQVERVHIHETQQDHNNFLKMLENEMEDEASESTENPNINDDEEAPQFRFKINEIHLAGVLTKAGNRQLWGTTAQQQSGLCWLLASGLGSTVKHSSSKSMAIVRSFPLFTKKLLNEDILWSISYAKNNLATNNGKAPAAEYVHIRNPDIIFS